MVQVHPGPLDSAPIQYRDTFFQRPRSWTNALGDVLGSASVVKDQEHRPQHRGELGLEEP